MSNERNPDLGRLIIARRPGESFMIGDEVNVRVLESRDGHIRFAITAPKSISVHRTEVWERIQEEKKDALCDTVDSSVSSKV